MVWYGMVSTGAGFPMHCDLYVVSSAYKYVNKPKDAVSWRRIIYIIMAEYSRVQNGEWRQYIQGSKDVEGGVGGYKHDSFPHFQCTYIVWTLK
jgi:hypothetical protein